jgi:hypothetical protein
MHAQAQNGFILKRAANDEEENEKQKHAEQNQRDQVLPPVAYRWRIGFAFM